MTWFGLSENTRPGTVINAELQILSAEKDAWMFRYADGVTPDQIVAGLKLPIGTVVEFFPHPRTTFENFAKDFQPGNRMYARFLRNPHARLLLSPAPLTEQELTNL